LQPSSLGGAGRAHANKVVVLVTDGMPNLSTTGSSTLNAYLTANPSSDWVTTGSNINHKNASIMQSMSMQLEGWAVFPVGIGLGTDYDFMDRMARTGGTANDSGQSPRGSGNPAQYEQRLQDIFEEIITSPKSRLVQ
jgi:hypothetical protein